MNENLTGRSHRLLSLLVLASFAISVAATVIDLGLSHTPFDTVDRLGRPMGFNSPLYPEHYGIMLLNFRPANLFRLSRSYDWLLFAAQIIGGVLLLRFDSTNRNRSNCRPGWHRWYFIAQWLLFPLGAFFLILAPVTMFNLVSGGGRLFDREDFTDVHLAMVVAQGTWLCVATIIAFAMKGSRLRLWKLWQRNDRAELIGWP